MSKIIECQVNDEYVLGSGVVIGAAGSYGDVILRLKFNEMWDGLAIMATFRDALNQNPKVVMLVPSMLVDGEVRTYEVYIPAEAKQIAGRVRLTLTGYSTYTVNDDGSITTFKDSLTNTSTAFFRVLESDAALLDDGSIGDHPTPTLAEQALAALTYANQMLDEAEQTNTDTKELLEKSNDVCVRIEPGTGENSLQQANTGARAISDSSWAFGNGSIAGIKGLYWVDARAESDTVFAFKLSNGLLCDGGCVLSKDHVAGYYSIGDVLTVHQETTEGVPGFHYYDAFKIIDIRDNADGYVLVAECNEEILLESIYSTNNDKFKNVIYCIAKPSCGEVDLGLSAFAAGGSSRALNHGATALGCASEAFGRYGAAVGRQTRSGYAAFAEGVGARALGDASHAEGSSQTQRNASYSHAEGGGTVSSNNYAHSEGWMSKARGVASHAEGRETDASGICSHAEGYHTHALSEAAHAEGETRTDDTATYKRSVIIGGVDMAFEPEAVGIASHREGRNTSAIGAMSHAEGEGSLAYARTTHAEGLKTNAIGEYSHAEGAGTTASGMYSHAGGLNTVAKAKAQTAIGQYNVDEPSAMFIVGAGSKANGVESRMNCFSTGKDANGKHYIKIGGTTLTEEKLKALLALLG